MTYYRIPWKWRLTSRVALKLRALDGVASVSLKGEGGKTYAEIHHGTLCLCSGYSIDGATWAPDFRRGMRGYFVHDALLQILDSHPGHYPEQVAHDAMLETHTADRFALARLYHWAVSSWPRQFYTRLLKKQLKHT